MARAISLIIIGSLILTGCFTRTVAVCPELPDIQRPMLPRINADDVQCLSDQTWDVLVMRERLRREYAEDLEAVIEGARSCDE
mgnify:CR=1 FL=1